MTADEFNAAYPVGTLVRYWPGMRYRHPGVESRTRTPAWTIADTPVVSVKGYPGGIALTHIEVVEDPR